MKTKSRFRAFLVCAIAVTALVGTIPTGAQAAFGLGEFTVTFTGPGGEPQLQAGSHPYALTAGFGRVNLVESTGKLFPDEAPKDVLSDLPPGFVAKANATPRCAGADFATVNEFSETACPDATAVGIAHAAVSISGEGAPKPGQPRKMFPVPIYNLTPGPGSVLKLGFVVLRAPVIVEGKLSQDPPYNAIGAATNITQAVEVYGTYLTLWGNPADPSHDPFRGKCLDPNVVENRNEAFSRGNCSFPAALPQAAFLTMPSNCAAPLQSSFEADSWRHPAAPGAPYPFQRSVLTFDSAGNPLSATGCENLAFDPHIGVKPTNPAAESPTGLDFELNVDDPGLTQPGGVAQSSIEKAVVTLPAGVTTNPSVAEGLGACGLDEYASETLDSAPGTGCPESSKVGSVEVETPLLEKEASEGGGLTVLRGSIYVAKQHDNPFHNLLTIYMVIKDPKLGILIKLPGKVEPDPGTGQLRTTFGEPGFELPQLPFSHFRLHFRKGERAPLITPPTCGTFTTQAELYPYSAPTSPRSQTASFTISAGADGSGCAGSPSQLPNRPTFSAGTLSPLAGAYSPFVLRLSRDDGTQQFSSISTTLPEGLTGRLAGIPYCPESYLARASAMGGEGEGAFAQATPACPVASEVGTVTVASGAGSEPLYVAGHAYLAGPYKGAPLSLEIITPAIAGPFDLGVVAVRTALRLDLETAEITAVSDPIPTILHGLPLDVRSIAIEMGRPNFIINPTSCEPKSILGSETSALGSVASLSQYFQVSSCARLGFKPTLKLRLRGKTKRSGHPALKAVVTYPKKGAYSNIARAQVGLPHSEFLDQGNLDKVCTQPELRSDSCPAKSIYGHAKAWTPLLDKPLAGPVYLAVGFGYKLPALVADLNGQVRILLKGKIDTTKHHGIRNTFEAVPDAPVSRFVLQMKGGKKYGLLQNSEDICRSPQHASARFMAQNGRIAQLHPRITNSCKKRSHGTRRSHTSHRHSGRGHR
jgi:hypothetical protein